MEFFPANSLDFQPDLHAFRDRWYVSHLLAMKEEPLLTPATDHPAVYRLLFLPTFDRPAVIRLTDAGGVWRAVFKRSNGLGGYETGQLTSEAEHALSPKQSAEFSRLVEKAQFWKMPSTENSGGLDGSQAVLEGVQSGQYHVVDRWSPRSTPYAELVEFLLKQGSL